MLERFFPDEYVDSAYGIPFEELYRKGYRGIIFDVDNTLVPHGAPADARSIGLFESLFKGGKPSVKGYERAMEVMGTGRENTLFIGDQLFTDVWGARRTGLYSILTKPMDPHEEIQIVFKRYLEAVVLRAYKKQRQKPDV